MRTFQSSDSTRSHQASVVRPNNVFISSPCKRRKWRHHVVIYLVTEKLLFVLHFAAICGNGASAHFFSRTVSHATGRDKIMKEHRVACPSGGARPWCSRRPGPSWPWRPDLTPTHSMHGIYSCRETAPRWMVYDRWFLNACQQQPTLGGHLLCVLPGPYLVMSASCCAHCWPWLA